SDIEGGWDEQDQSEVFDEDNQSMDGAGDMDPEMRTFEELPDVIDVTSAVGDADDEAALIAEELDDDEIIELESDAAMADFEDDELAARMPEELDDDSIDVMDAEEVYLAEEAGLDIRDDADSAIAGEASELSVNSAASDEVELEYAGDLDEASVRQGKRAAAMESRNLDDEDLEELGYPGEDEPGQHRPEAELQRRR
ncbi:MAG TPA: hypothetical protein VD906_08060, partial [Caulobacteraceae bacterium]|nr:hypothetical protein [Caulobacteraceae bacterium]